MGLSAEVNELIETVDDDEELVRRLEELARTDWRVGQAVGPRMPELYRRNRRVFLPLLEKFASPWTLRGVNGLDRWLEEVDDNHDLVLFRTIYQTWLQDTLGWPESYEQWAKDIYREFSEAPDRAARRDVVEKYRLGFDIPDDLATRMYGIDPFVTRDFVIGWLDFLRWRDDVELSRLAETVKSAGDDEFFFELYRKTFTDEQFRHDSLRLCEEVSDPQELCDELQRRHLEEMEGEAVVQPQTLLEILRKRGSDVVPYLSRVVPNTVQWGTSRAYVEMAELAEENRWWNLWGAIVRNHLSPEDFSGLVARLTDDRSRPDFEVAAQLSLVAGARTGWGSWRKPIPLSEEIAEALYERFPILSRGIFSPHLIVTPIARWGAHADTNYANVARLALDGGDTAMVDVIASHALLSTWGYYARKRVENLGWYEEHYRSLPDEEFAERALVVLGRIDEFGHLQTTAVRRRNPLYEVFFGDPRRYLSVADRLTDFLEANNDDVHQLGLRVLRMVDSTRGAEIAARHVRHLTPYLLNDSHRTTRILAFDALALAATRSEELGREVHQRARDALALRRREYPRDRLVELIGRIIHRWPSLRRSVEQPVIHERAEVS